MPPESSLSTPLSYEEKLVFTIHLAGHGWFVLVSGAPGHQILVWQSIVAKISYDVEAVTNALKRA
ncbi:hypothetical protein M7I_5135 [Glarea lozoyensis 74030]|uniref:Uncharacterized protein n=1 Tax=Glarea lozoyensis (strain ATCC 74030 / MF5533) TaxID=1104152 RepID=H0ER22_GLAL7|nr:hypothetical protein M7I_5135 [Glarea lozoyensis 74030]